MKKHFPFVTGRVLEPDEFVNRRGERQRICQRLLNGESPAITGEPRSGKTSLLHYLSHPSTRRALYEEEGERLVFYYTDAQAWEADLSPRKF